MGQGINLARPGAPLHAQVMDDFKDQLLIVLMKRLADSQGRVHLPIAEVDDTGSDVVAFRIEDGAFHFQLSKKQ